MIYLTERFQPYICFIIFRTEAPKAREARTRRTLPLLLRCGSSSARLGWARLDSHLAYRLVYSRLFPAIASRGSGRTQPIGAEQRLLARACIKRVQVKCRNTPSDPAAPRDHCCGTAERERNLPNYGAEFGLYFESLYLLRFQSHWTLICWIHDHLFGLISHCRYRFWDTFIALCKTRSLTETFVANLPPK